MTPFRLRHKETKQWVGGYSPLIGGLYTCLPSEKHRAAIYDEETPHEWDSLPIERVYLSEAEQLERAGQPSLFPLE